MYFQIGKTGVDELHPLDLKPYVPLFQIFVEQKMDSDMKIRPPCTDPAPPQTFES